MKNKTHLRKLLIDASARMLTVRVAMKKNISIHYCTAPKDGELVLSYKILFWDDYPRKMFTEKEMESLRRFANKCKADFKIEIVKAVEGREGLTREEVMALLPEEENENIVVEDLEDEEWDDGDFDPDEDDWGTDE